MRHVILVVQAKRGLIVLDRFVVVAVLEEQVADIRDRRDVARVEVEYGDEVL